jgi:flavin reductase (DIM6/NTAB) family NADH-FMN oxidoreductase RutF
MSNPDSINPFRQCLAQFATGVTVVTCSNSQGAPCGITANSFSAVSLDPPLVLWNIAKSSNSLQAYLDAKFFTIHVLTAAQRNLSSHFARSVHTLFEDIAFSRSENDVPILPDCLSRLECSTHAIHDCGDHYIIVGLVDKYSAEGGEPLLFFDGGYRAVDSTDKKSAR